MARHEKRTFGTIECKDLVLKPFTGVNAGMPELNLNPLDWSIYFNDFVAGHDYDGTISWTSTITSSGTAAMGDANHGTLVITNHTDDDDESNIQSIKECWKFVAGKKLFFCARFQVNDATQSEFLVGLAIRDTSPLDASDGTYFIKEDGEATYDFAINKNTTLTTTASVGTAADATYQQVAFYWDGYKMQAFVNGALVAVPAVTNICDDEELAITFAIKNGAGAAKSMTIDYVLVASER